MSAQSTRERKIAWKVGDACPSAWPPRVGSHDVDSPLGGVNQIQDGAQQRGLPGAVRPEEPGHLPGRDLERDVVDAAGGSISDRDVLHVEDNLPGLCTRAGVHNTSLGLSGV